MSQELARREPLNDRMMYAKALAEANLLPPAYRKQPANVLLAMEYGDALGLSPIAAIQGVHIIDGKPTASAQLIGALVRRAGHRLRVVISTDGTAAKATIVRADDPDFTFESVWTMQRAEAAGLTGKGTWKAYPANLLKARAITEVARDACPEALSGVAYTPEELGDDTPALAETRITRHSDTPPPTEWDTPEPVVEAEVIDLHPATPDLDASVARHPANGRDTQMRGNRTSPQATDAQLATIVKLTRQMGLDPRQTMTLISGLIHRHVDSMVTLTKAEASQVITGLKDSTPVEAYVDEASDE